MHYIERLKRIKKDKCLIFLLEKDTLKLKYIFKIFINFILYIFIYLLIYLLIYYIYLFIY